MNRERRQREGLDAQHGRIAGRERREHRGGGAGVQGEKDCGGAEGHAREMKKEKVAFR